MCYQRQPSNQTVQRISRAERAWLQCHQHGVNPLRTFGADHLVEPGKVDLMDLHIEKKKQGVQGLVLRGGRSVSVNRQVAEKRRHLVGTHGLGMSLARKKNKSSRPVQVCLFGSQAVMLCLDNPPQIIKKMGPCSAGNGVISRRLKTADRWKMAVMQHGDERATHGYISWC